MFPQSLSLAALYVPQEVFMVINALIGWLCAELLCSAAESVATRCRCGSAYARKKIPEEAADVDCTAEACLPKPAVSYYEEARAARKVDAGLALLDHWDVLGGAWSVPQAFDDKLERDSLTDVCSFAEIDIHVSASMEPSVDRPDAACHVDAGLSILEFYGVFGAQPGAWAPRQFEVKEQVGVETVEDVEVSELEGTCGSEPSALYYDDEDAGLTLLEHWDVFGVQPGLWKSTYAL